MSYMEISDWQIYDDEGRRKYVNAAELKRFLAIADRMTPRVKALCHVLAFTGCRVSEALALTRHQIDSDRVALVLRTLKRRKLVFRVIPIPDALMYMLLALPVDHAGRILPIHRATAYRQVKHIMTLVGIDGPRACPKGLRHGFGMRAAEASLPPNLIQRFMGHASGATSAIYLDATMKDARRFASRLW